MTGKPRAPRAAASRAPSSVSATGPLPVVGDPPPGGETWGPRPGDLFGGRYLLLEPVRVGVTTLWRAEDEVLARVVAVRVLELGPDDDGAEPRFLGAAALAGRVTGPQVASVLDAARGPDAAYAYIVAEWVDGQPLDEVLREGPLDPALAAAVTRGVAAALTLAHARGVHSRRLHPGQVLLCAGGVVKVTDLEVAAAVRALPEADDPVLSDTEDLGRLLHACLTSTWPVAPDGPPTGSDDWIGLPATPVRDERPCMPRQVRAGLPREVDAVVARVLEPGRRTTEPRLRTPAEVAVALAPWGAAATVSAVKPGRAAPAPTPGLLEHAMANSEDEMAPRRRRWWPRLLAALVILALIGAGGWAFGLVVGRVPNPKVATPLPKVAGQSAGASASAGGGAGPYTPTAVTSFDPMSTDKTENEATVSNAYDGNAATQWETEHYLTPNFGNLKTGVGLLVDLGSAKPVGKVVVDAPVGQTMVLYAAPGATTAPATLDALSAVTAPTDALEGDTTFTPTTATTTRWLVVWLTNLPMDPASDRPDPLHPFSGRITEMAFYPKA